MSSNNEPAVIDSQGNSYLFEGDFLLNKPMKQADPLPSESPIINLGTDVLFPKDKAKSDEFLKRLGETWPAQMVQGFVKGVTGLADISKRASQGEQIDVDEAVKAATDFSFEAYAASPLKQGAGIFGGRIRQMSKELAGTLEKRGIPEQEIKRITGLEKNVEGRWLYEIQDKPSKLIGKIPKLSEPRYLDEVFYHPELFERYPELKNVMIGVNSEIKPTQAYASDILRKSPLHIGIGTEVAKDPEKLRKVILHELQHYVQRLEDLPKGGNFMNQGGRLPEGSLIDWEIRTFKILSEKENLTTTEKAVLDAVAKNINRAMDKAGYRAVAGEVEARNVEARADFTMEDIWKKLGKSTEDIPREKQNIIKREHATSED